MYIYICRHIYIYIFYLCPNESNKQIKNPVKRATRGKGNNTVPQRSNNKSDRFSTETMQHKGQLNDIFKMLKI